MFVVFTEVVSTEAVRIGTDGPKGVGRRPYVLSAADREVAPNPYAVQSDRCTTSKSRAANRVPGHAPRTRSRISVDRVSGTCSGTQWLIPSSATNS